MVKTSNLEALVEMLQEEVISVKKFIKKPTPKKKKSL
jgi:hypothetical protein